MRYTTSDARLRMTFSEEVHSLRPPPQQTPLTRYRSAMSMLDSAWSLLALLTTNARTSYPWPLCWGNALWGYVAFKQDASKLAPASQPSAMFGVFGSFVLYTMPANFCANLFCFVRTPSALTNTTIIPVHLACCFLIGWVPGCAALLGSAIPFAVIDSLGVLDNATTGMNYMEEALALSGSPVLAMLAGMAVNLGGGLLRHPNPSPSPALTLALTLNLALT